MDKSLASTNFQICSKHQYKNSPQFIEYESWYLDLVCNNWTAIQCPNNQFVAIPLKRNFIFTKVYRPPLIQKFILPEMALSGFTNFLNLIRENYCAGLISLNANFSIGSGLVKKERINYTLALHNSYQNLYKSYTNHHKRSLHKCQKAQLKITTTDNVDQFNKFYHSFIDSNIKSAKVDKSLLENLVKLSLSKQSGFIISAIDANQNIHAACFFTKFNHRIVYLLAGTSSLGRETCAMYGIINFVIEKFAEQNYILDFEGSSIPGIAFFMSGFGSQKESYFEYSWKRNILCSLL
ncbi:MAG: hypothetical protein M3Q56_04495 [Bacteroidota bacterium]|nr:hypothetical protein [Bacteroidota bacterium]